MKRGSLLVAALMCVACSSNVMSSASTAGAGGAGGAGGGGGTMLVLPEPIDAVKLDGERSTTCARLADGNSVCWSIGGEPSYLSGIVAADEQAAVVGDTLPELPGALSYEEQTFDAGNGAGCIVTTDADILCFDSTWGSFASGTLVSVNRTATCWVGQNNAGSCGSFGEIPSVSDIQPIDNGRVALTLGGTVDYIDALNPGVVTLPGPASAIAAGGEHACAIVDGTAYCWGQGDSGQLSTSNTDAPRTEPRAIELPHDVELIAAGDFHSCAYTVEGHVWCWGDGDPVPVPVEL